MGGPCGGEVQNPPGKLVLAPASPPLPLGVVVMVVVVVVAVPLALGPQQGHHGQAQGCRGEGRGEQGGLGQAQGGPAEGEDGGGASQAGRRGAGAAQRAEVQGPGGAEGGEGAPEGAPTQAMEPVAPQEGGGRPRDDDVSPAHVGQLRLLPSPKQSPHGTPLEQGAHPARGALLLGHKVAVGLDVLAEGAGVRVALQAARHLAVVGLVHVVRARVLEAVARVGVALAAALVRTDVGLLPWRAETREEGG